MLEEGQSLGKRFLISAATSSGTFWWGKSCGFFRVAAASGCCCEMELVIDMLGETRPSDVYLGKRTAPSCVNAQKHCLPKHPQP